MSQLLTVNLSLSVPHRLSVLTTTHVSGWVPRVENWPDASSQRPLRPTWGGVLNSRLGRGAGGKELTVCWGSPTSSLPSGAQGSGPASFLPLQVPPGQVGLALFEALSLWWLNSGRYSRLEEGASGTRADAQTGTRETKVPHTEQGGQAASQGPCQHGV